MRPVDHHRIQFNLLLEDEDFPRRTAAAVLKRRAQKRMNALPIWVAALALFASGLLWFAAKNATVQFNGLTETSSRAVIQQAESAWQDTDTIINASLVIR